MGTGQARADFLCRASLCSRLALPEMTKLSVFPTLLPTIKASLFFYFLNITFSCFWETEITKILLNGNDFIL